MKSYSQPNFYHFAESSIRLAEYAYQYYKKFKNIKVLDLFSGCGVVGLEFYLRHSSIDLLVLNEYQQNFLKSLNENIEEFEKVIVENCDFREVKKRDFDLVLCNPPYFSEGTVRGPQSKDKEMCMVQKGFSWTDIHQTILRVLKSRGGYICLYQKANPPPNTKNAFKVKEINKNESLAHFILNIERD